MAGGAGRTRVTASQPVREVILVRHSLNEACDDFVDLFHVANSKHFHPHAAHGKRVPEFRAMSTVAEIIEAVKELPETEKGVRFRELDPQREPAASRGSLARKNGRWVLRGGEAAAAADAWETTREGK